MSEPGSRTLDIKIYQSSGRHLGFWIGYHRQLGSNSGQTLPQGPLLCLKQNGEREHYKTEPWECTSSKVVDIKNYDQDGEA